MQIPPRTVAICWQLKGLPPCASVLNKSKKIPKDSKVEKVNKKKSLQILGSGSLLKLTHATFPVEHTGWRCTKKIVR